MVQTNAKEHEIAPASANVSRAGGDESLTPAILANDFSAYQLGILHDWLKTITILAFTLVPLFFVLDLFFTPHSLLVRFAIYRLSSTALSVGQYLFVRKTRPSKWSYLHGYFASLQIGLTIVLMTVSLGGFDSSYYAGLNLVIVGVNLLLPWNARRTAMNALIIVGLYVAVNLIHPQPFHTASLANNLFFLLAMAVVAISINRVRYNLIEKEFSLLVEVRTARDALWGEMEVAKRIQTALLPQTNTMRGYEIAATMIPAAEVGGDYYDILESDGGERWVAIGDVSGHGVESGLVMMMAQTSIMTAIREHGERPPSDVMTSVNAVLRENISRLGSSHYMTLMLLKLRDEEIVHAGQHQDILIYRSDTDTVEVFPTRGTWMGITDDVGPFLSENVLPMNENDVILLYTDGVTELQNGSSGLFGQERLQAAFAGCAALPPSQALEALLGEIHGFSGDQSDDMTLVLVKRTGSSAGLYDTH